jgi:hypothetical protein
MEPPADDSVDSVLDWFDEDELSVCPVCGQRKVVPAKVSEEFVVCVSCGIVARPMPDRL